jgi:CRISPR/Cas system CSM-associated protein Csm5 (group 7 of RAMP superfamily)
MGTRGHQKVINKRGELKISHYNQWDSYPSGLGVEILDYLKQGNLDRYQKELDKIRQITDEEAKVVYADSERKVNYPYLSRDCGSKIHQMIEDGEVKFVQFIDDEEAKHWCEGFYTIDFQQNKFIAEFNGITREYSLDDLPTDEQFLRQMSDEVDETLLIHEVLNQMSADLNEGYYEAIDELMTKLLEVNGVEELLTGYLSDSALANLKEGLTQKLY